MAEAIKVHILGTGGIGSLVATSLAAKMPSSNIRLIVRKRKLGGALSKDVTLNLNRIFGVPATYENRFKAIAVSADGSDQVEDISNLVVATKAHQTADAIRPLLPSIGANTNILLLQNGMGVHESLCSKFWPDPRDRPRFILGVLSHGVKATNTSWTYDWAGDGTLRLGIVPPAAASSASSGRSSGHDPSKHDPAAGALNNGPRRPSVDAPLARVAAGARAGYSTDTRTDSEEHVRAESSHLDVKHKEAARNPSRTASEEHVHADNSHLDVKHKEAARNPSRTMSEEHVKADSSHLDVRHKEAARNPSRTTAEEHVKADNSHLDVRHREAARHREPTTQDEAEVRADHSSFDVRHKEAARNPSRTMSEEFVRADESPLDVRHKEAARNPSRTMSEEFVRADESPLDVKHREAARHREPSTQEEAEVKADHSEFTIKDKVAQNNPSRTESEQDVKADQSDFDVGRWRRREYPEKTASEEDVRADQSDFTIHRRMDRETTKHTTREETTTQSGRDVEEVEETETTETTSEQDVKADQSDFDVDRWKQRHRPEQTESEQDVRADNSEFAVKKKTEHKTSSSRTGKRDEFIDAATSEDVPFIVRALTGPDSLLKGSLLTYPDFVLAQFEKLVVNACINPLTAILGCKNGQLLDSQQSRTMISDIVRESCKVLQEAAKHEVPAAEQYKYANTLQSARMMHVVEDVCSKTALNESSMLADAKHGHKTEIDYINGYIVKQGQKYGIAATQNRLLTRLVRTTVSLRRELEKGFAPFVV